MCFAHICEPSGPTVKCLQSIPNLSKALSPKCERYASANKTRTFTFPLDLIENALAVRETVFSTTFSVWAVCWAMAELVRPSQRYPHTNCSNGVNSRVRIFSSKFHTPILILVPRYSSQRINTIQFSSKI